MTFPNVCTAFVAFCLPFLLLLDAGFSCCVLFSCCSCYSCCRFCGLLFCCCFCCFAAALLLHLPLPLKNPTTLATFDKIFVLFLLLFVLLLLLIMLLSLPVGAFCAAVCATCFCVCGLFFSCCACCFFISACTVLHFLLFVLLLLPLLGRQPLKKTHPCWYSPSKMFALFCCFFVLFLPFLLLIDAGFSCCVLFSVFFFSEKK